jgi:hypothetical protein
MIKAGKKTNNKRKLNSKGAAIFKKILEDKEAIHAHIQKGGKLIELKKKYKFLDPLSLQQAK